MRLELHHPPEHILLQQTTHRQKVGIPPPVLVHAQQTAALARQQRQLVGLARRRHEGLLDQHVLAGLERGARERVVRVGRRAQDDDVEGGVAEQRVQRGDVLDGGVVGGGGVVRGRGALQDGVQREGGGEGDEGDVEDFGGEAWGLGS